MIKRIGIVCLLLFSSSVDCSADFLQELQLLSRIDLLPLFTDKIVVKQISSYDTTGGNNDGFSGKYSYLRKENNNLVIADLKGAGVIHRIWTPTPTEDTIQFFFDGESKPRISMKFIDLFSGEVYPFINPIVGNEIGGYYCYIPIPYQKSCKVVFKGKKLRFFQIQYKEYTTAHRGESFPVEFSDKEEKALAQAAKLWSSYGGDIHQWYSANSAKVKVREKTVVLKPGETTNLFKEKKGGRVIGFELTPLASLHSKFKDILIKARWDGEKVHSINSPLTDFFGYAFGKRAMQSLLVGVRNNTHYSYLPMPYEQSASIDLAYLKHARQTQKEIHFKVKVYYTEEERKLNEGKLYVRWRREINPEKGKPYKILEAKGRGHQVGTILQTQGLNPGMTFFFEGDDSTVVDGQLSIHGTGSEDFFNGGWYAVADKWDQGYSLPLHGALTYSVPLAQTGGYRFNITDKVPFEESYLLAIEHGPEGNKLPVDYTSVAFYYSDTPPRENQPPSPDLLEIVPPEKLEYWTNLLPVTALSPEASLSYERLSNREEKRKYKVFRLSAGKNGFAKFELELPPEGEYLLYMSYFKCPSCGTFQLSQRQNTISELIDSQFTENVLVEKELIGSLYIKEGTNSITVRIKSNGIAGGKTDFVLHRFFLEKKKEVADESW